MRVLYVITDLYTGGVPLHLLRLATFMKHQGVEVRVICLSPPGPVSTQIVQAGIPTAACGAQSIMDLRALFKLRRHIKEFAPDLIHSLLFHANVASRLVLPTIPISTQRLICEIQTVEIERRWHLIVDGLTHSLCRWVIGNSQSVVDHLQRCAHIPQNKLKLIPGGVDVSRVMQASPASMEELGIGADARVLMWVGRMDPVKGLEDLLQAMRVLVRADSRIRLVMVGEGPYRSTVLHRIQEWKLEPYVILTGVREDVPSLLKVCDVFVFPSHTEGMPNAVLEAMAASRIIVCTDVPGNRDVVKHKQTGILVPPHDPGRLAKTILEVIGEPALFAELGHRAHTDVAERYDHKLCFRKYLELYHQASSHIS